MSEYAKKVDNNHDLIREYIRKLGYFWIDTAKMGYGFPDSMVIAKNGLPVMFEIKSRAGRMTWREKQFRDDVRERGYPFYFIVFTPEDAEHALAYAEAFELVEKKPRGE